jgi:hypothetical protein
MPWLTVRESPVQLTLKGVTAGLVGTLVMTGGLQAAARVLGRRVSPEKPDDVLSSDEDASAEGPPSVPPTERVAERLATQVFGTELSPEIRQRLGVGVHWAYGACWGALSAPVQLTLRPPVVPYGIALGLAVWLVGPARLVPALGLYARPASSGLGRRLLAIGLHVLFGLSTALTLERLSSNRSS